MDSTEVRYGNYVQDSRGKIEVVTSIQDDEINHNFQGGYSGIPLTEELLLKCGFYSSECGERFNPEDELAEVFEYRKESGIYYRDLVCCPFKGLVVYIENSEENTAKIEYVHQLQNLYYALIGEELPLTL